MTSVTNSFGTFSFTETATGTELISFNITMTGVVLAGIAVKDGAGTVANFYSVNDEITGVLEGPVFTPTNASGGHGGLSSLDFLLEGGPAHVPDGGTTAMLLGGALTCLGVVRRYLKR